ncbi:MAG: hypothetical protein LUG16_00055 [Candidatus Gastranaerophilales bacterium]|nr:hypothetical protein [Candidatus Gastranaerophilales bacterium]
MLVSTIGKTNNHFEREYSYNKTANSSSQPKQSSIPVSAENIKANLCPAFGRQTKIADIYLKDKYTGKNVKASLNRERIGDYSKFKVYVDRKEAGYLDMDTNAVFPENSYLLSVPDNNIPQVSHIRSLMGKKYEGIGTALINAAVFESKLRGKNGVLWTKAQKGYAANLAEYRSNENPIPFYYKVGFKAVDEHVHQIIEECLKQKKYEELPKSALLLLEPNALTNKDYIASSF